ncbi:MAG: hypothetical protein GEU93_12830 [Propionibacteriales bacterium]|nr:hypothetical protein [Propionibacteriales bacterium]
MILPMADEQSSTFLVLYHYVPDMERSRAPHREAHLAWLHELADSGHVLLAGATRDPVDTAVLIVRAADTYAVRRLLLDDPYAQANLIDGLTVRPVGLAVGPGSGA